ncbi:hypothetical protein FHT28_002802 [Rhizobium sp. SG570]|nr:hypothetical protein [Rhizobium sp. SG570]
MFQAGSFVYDGEYYFARLARAFLLLAESEGIPFLVDL